MFIADKTLDDYSSVHLQLQCRAHNKQAAPEDWQRKSWVAGKPTPWRHVAKELHPTGNGIETRQIVNCQRTLHHLLQSRAQFPWSPCATLEYALGKSRATVLPQGRIPTVHTPHIGNLTVSQSLYLTVSKSIFNSCDWLSYLYNV